MCGRLPDLTGIGIADALQPDVASVPAATGAFVTLDAAGHALHDVQVYPTPAGHPAGVTFPYGFFGFTLPGLAPGGSATVRLILPPDAHPDHYFTWNGTTGQYAPFDFDGTTGAEIHGNVVTLHLVDGGRGDEDGLANGTIVDPGGPGSGVLTVAYTSGLPLGGWTAFQTGGSPNGQGSVSHDSGGFVLTEGDSLTSGIRRGFTVPDSPTLLTFTYTNLTFDTAATHSITAAFEAAFLDASGHTLAYTLAKDRDAFFNVTDGLTAALGRDTTTQDQGAEHTVNLDLSKLFPGTSGTLVFRLVHNDSDVHTSVRVRSRQASVSGAPSVNEGSPYTLNLSVQSPATIQSWTIDWGDGHTDTVPGNPATATHTYADGLQQYTIHATAMDDDGGIPADPLTVTVNNVPPTASITGPTTANEGSAVTYAGSFTDPAAAFDVPYSYAWSVTASNGQSIPGASGSIGSYPGSIPNFSFTPADEGTYTVSLVVTDGDGGTSPTATRTLTVTNVAPTVQATSHFELTHSAGGAPQVQVDLSGSFSGECRVAECRVWLNAGWNAGWLEPLFRPIRNKAMQSFRQRFAQKSCASPFRCSMATPLWSGAPTGGSPGFADTSQGEAEGALVQMQTGGAEGPEHVGRLSHPAAFLGAQHHPQRSQQRHTEGFRTGAGDGIVQDCGSRRPFLRERQHRGFSQTKAPLDQLAGDRRWSLP